MGHLHQNQAVTAPINLMSQSNQILGPIHLAPIPHLNLQFVRQLPDLIAPSWTIPSLVPDHRTGEASHRPARVQLGVVVGAQIQLIQISRRILQIIREKVALTHFRLRREVFSITYSSYPRGKEGDP